MNGSGDASRERPSSARGAVTGPRRGPFAKPLQAKPSRP